MEAYITPELFPACDRFDRWLGKLKAMDLAGNDTTKGFEIGLDTLRQWSK